MSLTAAAVKRRTFTLFATFVLVLAGVASYFTLGQLEDPEFTIKNAVVVTAYPGASPEEVELEVTDRLELAIQQMPQVKYVSSSSRQGLSQITVAIQPQYRSGQLPQIWDELRRKVSDTRRQFPPGVGEPRVVDDFGDVYGFLLGAVADGFSEADLERYVDGLRKELSLLRIWSTLTPAFARRHARGWPSGYRTCYRESTRCQHCEVGPRSGPSTGRADRGSSGWDRDSTRRLAGRSRQPFHRRFCEKPDCRGLDCSGGPLDRDGASSCTGRRNHRFGLGDPWHFHLHGRAENRPSAYVVRRARHCHGHDGG